MNRRSICLSILALSVASCSSVRNNQASGDFDYATAEDPKPLTVPSALAKPNYHDEYQVDGNKVIDGPIGKDVDVRAPSLVLPIAASSRIETGSDQAIIWFDKVLEDRDLKTFINEAVKEFLTEQQVAVISESDDGLTLVSDWFHDEESSGIIFENIDVAESKRFQFNLTTKPHGRSVSLQVTMIDYMKTDALGATKKADIIDQHRAEMALLNAVTAKVDEKYRKQQRDNRLLRASQKLVSIGENPEAEAAYIIEMESSLLWSNLPIFFERYGFTIYDLNEDKQIYYVEFAKPSVSLWDKIWGEDTPIVELENQRYQFVLSELEQQTALTIYDEEGAALTQETLEFIFPVMEPALSFRDL
ncbi:outer membrane protein assembly factor BamC [Colwellia sp. MEBiC06753]